MIKFVSGEVYSIQHYVIKFVSGEVYSIQHYVIKLSVVRCTRYNIM